MPFVGLCLLAIRTTCLFGCTHPSCGLLGCNPLCEHIFMMLVCSMHTLFHSVWWYACLACFMPFCLALFVSLHLCTFAYMFMHVSLCMLVYVIKLGSTISCGFTPILDTQDLESLLGTLFDSTRVSFILQYIGTMDIKSKPTFVPLGHTISLDNMYDFFFLVFPFVGFLCCLLSLLLVC